MPEGGGDDYQTLSGWLMNELDRVPKEADRITAGDWTSEVVDMDITRVDKVLAMRRKALAQALNTKAFPDWKNLNNIMPSSRMACMPDFPHHCG